MSDGKTQGEGDGDGDAEDRGRVRPPPLSAEGKVGGAMAAARVDHGYPFDPTYGYDLAALLAVRPPVPPADLESFWITRYDAAMAVDPAPKLSRNSTRHETWDVLDLQYRSTDDMTIGGWLLVPRHRPVVRGLVIGHGYGGRDGPDTHLPVDDAAILFPCFRGLSRSARHPISQDSNWHVLHDIDKRDRYIIGGCVQDLWIGVSVLLVLFPWLTGKIGYAGISFGGGLGGLAIPWDRRIARGHLSLPTFGHHPLRLTLPSVGSVAAVQNFHRDHPDVTETLAYYDAAATAQRISAPMLIAAALLDPMVPPPGQFAIYNALSTQSRKQLFTLSAGHIDYAAMQQEEHELLTWIREFFAEL